MLTIYLASRSSRRHQILQKIGILFCVVPSTYRERIMRGVLPHELVIQHACGKVRKAIVPKKAKYVLGVDTIVFYQKQILGKPKTKKEARHMLRQLSGHVHFVYSGLALQNLKTGELWTDYSKTKVYFKRLRASAIQHYIQCVNPMDKAGAYGIQEGPRIVKRIEGSYTNVVGLPVELLKKMLKSIVKT